MELTLLLTNYDIIVSAALLANFFTWYFRPLDDVREYIVDKWVNFFLRKNMFWATRAIVIVTCPKCLAFWSILLYTFNLPNAIAASILALAIKKFIQYVESELE
jgi:hypothetical protein